MKTKIIYISGSEAFDVADIRAAFEEVRQTLGLASNVVLFGVPVDADDAGIYAPKVSTPEKELITPITTTIIEPEFTEEITPEISVVETAPAKKTPKRKAKEKPAEKIIQADVTPIEIEPTPASEKIIPILSILSGGGDDVVPEQETEADTENNPEIETEPEEPAPDTIKIESMTVKKVTVQNADSYEEEIIATGEISIEDSLADDAPEEDQEKTLEQLLAKMKPLREDHGEDIVPKKISAPEPENEPVDVDMGGTLEQLATEFSETQDKIVIDSKSENTGKIGKLKNILPFKKAKREESGFMGDLFGWAGIAANDDEFSIPGFFTTSASKK